VSAPSGPLIRPSGPRRPSRQQIARRRTFAALIVVLIVGLVWFMWPGGDATRQAGGRSPDPADGGGGGGNGNGNGGGKDVPDDAGVIVPGENPIEHVIFLVKENRSFDHYFGRYPGVEGATSGETMDCSTFADAGTVKL
jgi:phospholipase C